MKNSKKVKGSTLLEQLKSEGTTISDLRYFLNLDKNTPDVDVLLKFSEILMLLPKEYHIFSDNGKPYIAPKENTNIEKRGYVIYDGNIENN